MLFHAHKAGGLGLTLRSGTGKELTKTSMYTWSSDLSEQLGDNFDLLASCEEVTEWNTCHPVRGGWKEGGRRKCWRGIEERNDDKGRKV